MKALGIKTVLCGLVTASMFGLAGCEELMEPKSAVKEKPTATPVSYRAADEESIKERWSAIPVIGGGRSAAMALSWASAVDENTTTTIPGLTLVDAREYGGCEVFTADYQPLPGGVVVKIGFLDCIDRKEKKSGHYHVAAVCIESYMPLGDPEHPEHPEHPERTEREPSRELVVVRAGDRERNTTQVTVTVDEHEQELDYHEYETNYHAGGVYELKWAWGDEPVIYELIKRRVESRPGDLEFSITSDQIVDSGRSALLASDSGAVADYTKRCAGFEE